MVRISDSELVGRLLQLAGAERAMLGEVLKLLREVEKRKLYLDRGHPSLYSFCVRELGYSEHVAHARIQVSRLSCTVPEVEAAVGEGRISITIASMAQVHFRRAEKAQLAIAPERQLEIVRGLYGISTKEAEKSLAEIFPEPPARQRASYSGNGLVKISFSIPEDLYEDVQELFRIRSHTNPSKRWEKLLSDLVKLGWKKWHPINKEGRLPRLTDVDARH